MNRERIKPTKIILKVAVYLLAAFGVFSLLWFAKSIYLPCVFPTNDYCQGPYEQIQSELFKTGPIVSNMRSLSKPVSGFCEDVEVKKLLSAIPPQFTAECIDTENSFTIAAWNPKKPRKDGWCVDGLGHLTSTKITKQDGIECQ